MRAAAVLACFISACSVTEQRRQLPSSVPLVISNPAGVSAAAPLRYAVVWFHESGLFVTDDQAIGPVPLEEEVALVEVQLSMPPSDILPDLMPMEDAELVAFVLRGPLHRPRLVVYADVDFNGAFFPPIFGLAGVDQVMAVDTASSTFVGAFTNLDETLASMTLEEQDVFYRATEGAYTPFVRVREGFRLTVIPDPAPPIAFALSDSPVPLTRLECMRNRVGVFGTGIFATSRVTARVDVGLDLDVVCGAKIAQCTSEDFEALVLPAVEAVGRPAMVRVSQCRHNDRFEVLVIHEAERVCEPCVCTMDAHAVAYVTGVGAGPSWWPCGTDIAWCESDLPLYTIDPMCIPEEEEEM